MRKEIGMGGTSPLVSVVIPTYERADRLPRAVESVLSQTYSNIEVLVVNDNEPDSAFDIETERVLASFEDERLRVLHTVGRTGGGAARNYCCENARGEYLAFLDDDDEYEPDKIETQLSFMLQNDLDMSWQDVAWYDEGGKLVERRQLDHAEGYDQESLLRAHLKIPISPTSIYMLKRKVFEKTDGFGEVATGQDWWLMLRCIESGARIGYMPGVHVRQYLHAGKRLSLGNNKIRGEEERHRVVQGYYDRLSREEIRFIEFRHNAVLAISSIRSHSLISALGYLAKALAISPVDFLSEGKRYLIKAKK